MDNLIAQFAELRISPKDDKMDVSTHDENGDLVAQFAELPISPEDDKMDVYSLDDD